MQIVGEGDDRLSTVLQHRHQTSTLEQNIQFGSDDDMKGGEVAVEGVVRGGVTCSREQTLSESEVSTRDVEVHNVSES